MGGAWWIDTLQSCRAWTLCTSTLRKKEEMGRQRELAASLLILVLMAYICEAALLRKSSAADFLRSGREKRAARCVNGDCSSENSESEEILEANSDYEQENSKMLFPGGSQVGVLKAPFGGSRQEGSGM
ncbi:hypothetical protein PHYPO_G00112340 [Pangasianodon hypophthalmus]|uniref:Uncharacterized protein n=1 Tax=Pangasianodon hypophthalmus TaxID=310915 RepID=A0A5N5L2E2_PANHP|nr:hypothetical protein PHYPO_G00112340 [Pangasianodon hypophthalmus]